MPPLFPRNPAYKNTSVPRSAIRNYTIKNNISRTPTAFLATNTNMTRRMKIKQNRANVEAQNLIRRVQVMVNNARKNKNKKNNTPIPFDSYIKILKATKISDLASIGINTTSSKDDRAKLKNYKILVLNELFTLFLVIIGEILEYTINGDLRILKDKIHKKGLEQIEEGREALRRYFDPSIPFMPLIMVIRCAEPIARLAYARGGSLVEVFVTFIAIAFGWTIISSPFIYGFNLYVYINDSKQELNFMQLLLLTYKTFFSSNAAIEYKNEINYYQINQAQKNLFYQEADTFKNANINDFKLSSDLIGTDPSSIANRNDRFKKSAFKRFLEEFLKLKIDQVVETCTNPPPRGPGPDKREPPSTLPWRPFTREDADRLREQASGTGLSEARRFPTVVTTGQKPTGTSPPPVRSFLPPTPLRSSPLGATPAYYGIKPTMPSSIGPAPGIRPTMPSGKASNTRTPDTIQVKSKPTTVKEILASYEAQLKKQTQQTAELSAARRQAELDKRIAESKAQDNKMTSTIGRIFGYSPSA